MNVSHLAVAALVLVLGAPSVSAQASAAKDSSRRPTGAGTPTPASATLKCGNDSLVQCMPTKAAKDAAANAGNGGPVRPGVTVILRCGSDSLVQRGNAGCAAKTATTPRAKLKATRDTAMKKP